MKRDRMKVVPLDKKTVDAFIELYHRHHKPVTGDKFRIGCVYGDTLVGVANVGRPVSRLLDDGETLEVTRLCTDGTHNACSFLYSSCARIAKDMGYKKIITYILESETGASLKASGWEKDGITDGRTWDTPARRRTTEVVDLFGETHKYPTENKQRWVKLL